MNEVKPMDGCPNEETQGTDQMHITATTHHMTPAEVGLWDALRAYLNLPVPLAAVLRCPYAFLRPAGSAPESVRASATILPLRRSTKSDGAGDIKESE